MTAEALADKFNAKGRKWPRRAVCPVHQRQGQRYPSLTLAIYADEDRARLWCPAGCKADDILAAVGLTWKDTLYAQRQRLPPEEYKAHRRKQELKRQLDIRLRRIGLMLWLWHCEPTRKSYWNSSMWSTYREISSHWKEAYSEELLPIWMRPRIERFCSICGFKWERGYAGQICPFTPMSKEDREHVMY